MCMNDIYIRLFTIYHKIQLTFVHLAFTMTALLLYFDAIYLLLYFDLYMFIWVNICVFVYSTLFCTCNICCS